MHITSITPHKFKKGYYRIRLDTGSTITLSEETIIALHLTPNKTLTSEDIKAIRAQETRFSAFSTACNLLSYRARSVKEIKQRLKAKKHSDHDIRITTEKLKSLGYVNDDEFARQWVSSRKIQNKGKALIKAELVQKGISAESIALAIEGMYRSPDEERRQVMAFAKKKAAQWKNVDTRTLSARLMRYLAGRGFSIEVVYDVVGKVIGANEDD